VRGSKNRYWILGVVILVLIVLGAGGILFFQAGQVLAQFEKDRPLPGAVLKDKNGAEIKRLGTGSVFVPLEKIPKELQTAVVDYQDENFHRKKKGPITRRLARIVQTPAGFWSRLKAKALPTVLARRYSKEDILEMYLNEASFGEGIRGVEAASQTYFAKPVQDLALAESALLAALAENPAELSPYSRPQEALKMRNEVLGAMHRRGHLEKSKQAEAVDTDLNVKKNHTPGKAHHFSDHVSHILSSQFGEEKVMEGGLEVETTLDLKVQEAAEAIFQNRDSQGALVALNPQGEVLALVGGRNYAEDKQNLATNEQKDVGFTLRPLIYALGLKKDWPMNKLVEDVKREFNGFAAENKEGRYWGPVTMKHALTLNLNAAAAHTLDRLGLDQFINFAKELGLELDKGEDTLALSSGVIKSKGLSLLELTAAYLPFLNEGRYMAPQAVIKAVDDQGREIFTKDTAGREVLTKEQAFLLTYMLTEKEEEIPAAVNNSPSEANSGQWCLGYTPRLLVGVFVPEGEADEAQEIWREFMTSTLITNTLNEADEEEGGFDVPENVETGILIDVFTGLLANSRCPQVERSAFIKGTAPTEFAPCALRAETPTQPPTEPLTRPGAPPVPPTEPPITEPPKPPEIPETAPPVTEPPTPPEIPDTGPEPPAETPPEPENSAAGGPPDNRENTNNAKTVNNESAAESGANNEAEKGQ